jgi:ribonucrease Y
MRELETILGHGALVAAGALLTWLLIWYKGAKEKKANQSEAERDMECARAEAEKILREARLAANEQALKLIEETEKSFAARRAERAELERRLSDREILINSQLGKLVDAEKCLDEQKKFLAERNEEARLRENALAEQERKVRETLETVSGLSASEAREAMLRKTELEAAGEAQGITRNILEQARAVANEKARHILSTAIQRYAGEYTFQTTTTTVAIQGEDIKGRIIGREGRNIRAFEAATGVTVLIDDTPGAVLLSGFDPVRREIARETMLRLIQDGRIHPTRIEEIVAQVTQETNATVQRLGEEAVAKVGVPAMAPELVVALGRLHFRHSYSQNILEHSIEVAHVAGLIAAELGLDVALAKRVGLLHDIGKTVSHEVEGPHAIVGAELARRYGECDPVVNGIASHHNDVAPIGPLGILVSAADAISASRPGARSETMSTYLKRVEELEKIAGSFAGVEKAFAVQAGRELRVFVQPEAIDDQGAYALARSITGKIQEELQYPGQIKVVVIRETRCVEVAK